MTQQVDDPIEISQLNVDRDALSRKARRKLYRNPFSCRQGWDAVHDAAGNAYAGFLRASSVARMGSRSSKAVIGTSFRGSRRPEGEEEGNSLRDADECLVIWKESRTTLLGI